MFVRRNPSYQEPGPSAIMFLVSVQQTSAIAPLRISSRSHNRERGADSPLRATEQTALDAQVGGDGRRPNRSACAFGLADLERRKDMGCLLPMEWPQPVGVPPTMRHLIDGAPLVQQPPPPPLRGRRRCCRNRRRLSKPNPSPKITPPGGRNVGPSSSPSS